MIGDELNLAKNSEFLKAKTNLDSIKDFLDIVSDNYFESCNFAHQKFLLNLYGCEGAIETLKSILILLNAGQFISSFSLLRKFRDELFFSIFVLYENKLHEENDSKETYTSIDLSNDDEILKSLQKYIENDSKFTKNNEIYVANDKWLNNKINKSITETNKIRRDYFSYSGYLSNVLKNKDIKLVYDRFFAKGKIIDLQEINNELDNFMHFNGIKYISNRYYLQNLIASFDKFTKLLNDITAFFFSCIYILNSTLFRSSDYIASLEAGIKPIEGSQYSIAPGVQDFIDLNIKHSYQELFTFLMNDIKTEMTIE